MGNSYGTQFGSLLRMIDSVSKLDVNKFNTLLTTPESTDFPLTTWKSHQTWINKKPMGIVEYCFYKGKYQPALLLLKTNKFNNLYQITHTPLQIITQILSQEMYFDYRRTGIFDFSRIHDKPHYYLRQKFPQDIYLDLIINFFLHIHFENHSKIKNDSSPETLHLQHICQVWNHHRDTYLVDTNWIEMIFYYKLTQSIETLFAAAEKEQFIFPENFGHVSQKGCIRHKARLEMAFNATIKDTHTYEWRKCHFINHLIKGMRHSQLHQILQLTGYQLTFSEDSQLCNHPASNLEEYQNLLLYRLKQVTHPRTIQDYFQALYVAKTPGEKYTFLTVAYIDSLTTEIQQVILVNYPMDASLKPFKHLVDLDLPITSRQVFALLAYNDEEHNEMVKHIFAVRKMDDTLLTKNGQGNDYLHVSLGKNNATMIEFFLPRYRYYNTGNRNKDTYFSLACRMPDDKYARQIYTKNMKYSTLRGNCWGKTGAFYLLQKGHLELFQTLMADNKIDWTLRTRPEGDTIMHYATRFCQDGKVLIQLLQHYAKTHSDTNLILNKKNKAKETPRGIIKSRTDLKNKECVLAFFENFHGSLTS